MAKHNHCEDLVTEAVSQSPVFRYLLWRLFGILCCLSDFIVVSSVHLQGENQQTQHLAVFWPSTCTSSQTNRSLHGWELRYWHFHNLPGGLSQHPPAGNIAHQRLRGRPQTKGLALFWSGCHVACMFSEPIRSKKIRWTPTSWKLQWSTMEIQQHEHHHPPASALPRRFRHHHTSERDWQGKVEVYHYMQIRIQLPTLGQM